MSDRSSRGDREDTAGPALKEKILAQGWNVARQKIIPDDIHEIQRILTTWSNTGDLHIILTTGGTGFSPRDVTPDATQSVIDRPAPGITEAMRAVSRQVTPHAMLSRAVAGIRKRTLIINLPGSPTGALENLEVALPVLLHAVELLTDNPKAEAGHRKI